MKKNPFLMFNAALTGIGYGIPITIVCMALIGGWQEPLGEFTVWTVASALIGLLSAIVFTSDRLSLPAELGLHCTGTLAIVTGACWLCGYDSNPLAILTGILPVFLVIYALIYGINYFAIKQEEKRVNAALDQNG